MALTDRDAREPAASDERHRPAVYAWAMGPSRRSPVAHLEAHERRQLLEDLNYLNLAEIRSFCTAHSIPRVIHIEAASGERRKTKETDRKSVVLERVRHYLKTGRVPDPTCFPAKVVWSGSARRGKLKPSDRLYYGTYDKHDPEMLRVLESLTDGRFRSGAVARILCREFWTDGVRAVREGLAARERWGSRRRSPRGRLSHRPRPRRGRPRLEGQAPTHRQAGAEGPGLDPAALSDCSCCGRPARRFFPLPVSATTAKMPAAWNRMISLSWGPALRG